MDREFPEIVITLTGWTIVLTRSAGSAVLAVNNWFDTIHARLDALQNLILQNISLHPENQRSE